MTSWTSALQTGGRLALLLAHAQQQLQQAQTRVLQLLAIPTASRPFSS